MAAFDLECGYPRGGRLVATGKPTAVSAAAKTTGQQTSHWVSERPIPLAGFNLGKYKVATARAGDVTVETYATTGGERDFPSPRIQAVQPNPSSTAAPPRPQL